jgi:hypothetical protein
MAEEQALLDAALEDDVGEAEQGAYAALERRADGVLLAYYTTSRMICSGSGSQKVQERDVFFGK